MEAVDDDTLQAVIALWQASPAITALAPASPATGVLKSTREAPLPLPYAHVACEAVPGKSTHYVKAIRKDVRKVTLTVRGTYDQCKAVLAAVLAVFNLRMAVLPFPSGARFIKWWPTNDGTITREEGEAAIRQGQETWRAVIEAEVYSTRAEA